MTTTLFRGRLLASTVIGGTLLYAAPVAAQTQVAAADIADAASETIVVTGSRIARPNMESSSPVAVVTGEQTLQHADVTLDTFLNTLPQVNPAGTSTSNNPGNGGQSNVNLRGLGSNRNLVLVDGRRPMVSSTDLSVDLNTIPQQLIERIDVVTGGAGATYGADAIAGVVNIRLKNNFEGLDIRATYSNSIPRTDAREYQISTLIGGNFADGRGNIAFSMEYAERQPLIKAQRSFSNQATSTTGTPPVGRLVEVAGNPITQAAINAVFAGYGVAAAQAPTSGLGIINFNSDGTLFSAGVFNNPLQVANYRYDPLGQDAAAANLNFFPDIYSYNFDAINLLVLPLKRKSAFMRAHYEVSPAFEFFTQAGYTNYTSSTALAPTPIGTRIYAPTVAHAGIYAQSPLVAATGTGFITNSIVPVTNPFIPADLRTLLASRTGDDTGLVGAGATEPIRLAIRSLSTGLRFTNTDNEVLQALGGVRGELTEGWNYEAYYSWGQTKIRQQSTGGVDVQRLQTLLEAADGGASICTGGYNPFGIQPISASCVEYLSASGAIGQTYRQNIAQAFVTGELAELPAGTLSVVGGVENRRFRFANPPSVLSGPIAGPNTQVAAAGKNSFLDFFGELYVPIMKGQQWAESLDLTIGYRSSKSDFTDIENGVEGAAKTSDAYKAELTWSPIDEVRFRGSYQHSVRAPNFGELFSGGSSFPQVFDPCSVGTNFRTTGGAAATALCTGTGVAAAGVNTFVATPGLQIPLGLAGNTNLKPESADTYTAGVTFQAFGLIGSIDYYNIRIKKPIFGPDTNIFIAACYNYLGGLNTTLATTNPYCQSIVRSGSNFSFIAVPAALGGDANSNFTLLNQGKIKTSGVDIQLAYNLPTEFVAPESSLGFNLYMNYLIDFKSEELPGVVLDYADTASYFGAGLGTSFPRFKANLNVDWKLSPITLSSRIRYIDGMSNRASLQFPGETFSGPKAITYFDFAAQADIGPMLLRIGLNNAFNKSPPTYQPNVQSGTDPSLYDVIGRRGYVTLGLKF